MKRLFISLAAGCSAALFAASALALEIDPNVPPEISLGGRLIATANLSDTERPVGGNKSEAALDIADSSILISASKYMFDAGDYGYAVFGLILPEDDSDLPDEIFVHQALVGMGSQDYDFVLGRTRLPNTLVSFPTIRDDDLLDFTHVGNAGANVEAEEDQIFGGVLGGTRYLWTHFKASAFATARAETDLGDLASTERSSRSNLNGASLGFAYEISEAIKFDRGLRYAGVGLDWQRVDELAGGDDDDVTAFLAGLSYNLNDHPEAGWAVDFQGIYNFGAGVANLNSDVTRARAEQYALVGALRYTDRPHLQTNWQAALTLAWKDYADFNDASSLALVPSVAWRLGSGIEAVGQYRYLNNGATLGTAENKDASHTLFLGLSFAFDTTFNESVGARGSILNLEHNMLNPGPAGLGH
jgi:hypothetical protein